MPTYYNLDSTNKFISPSRNGGIFTIIVYELNTQNPCNATLSDFKEIERVGRLPRLSFNALEIRGFRIEGTRLRTLAEDLFNANIIVNNEGFGYFLTQSRVDTSVSRRIEFYRLNELFDWSTRGVLLPKEFETKWNRCISGRRETRINYLKMENELKDCQKERKKKEAELKAKEKEINDAKGKLKTIEDELNDTNTKIGIKDQKIRDKQAEIDRLRAELENCRRNDPGQILRRRRVRVPSNMFLVQRIMYPPGYSSLPSRVRLATFTPLDQSPPTLRQRIEVAPVDGRFDVNNWWMIKVREDSRPLIYYEGNYTTNTFNGVTVNAPCYQANIMGTNGAEPYQPFIKGAGYRWAHLLDFNKYF